MRLVRREVKRHAGIDAVERLTRYLELLDRGRCWPRLRACSLRRRSSHGHARWPRTAAYDAVVLDYDAVRGIEREGTLF